MSKIKMTSLYIMGIAYILAGINHFVMPDFYLAMMPPYIPWHKELVLISGLIEIGLGALLFVPQYRKYAAWGLIIMLLAVFPANFHLALTNGEPLDISPFAAWARLPIQGLLIGWAWWHTFDKEGKASKASKPKSNAKPKAKTAKSR
ncbi:DoxX family protein [soil metagenome]